MTGEMVDSRVAAMTLATLVEFEVGRRGRGGLIGIAAALGHGSAQLSDRQWALRASGSGSSTPGRASGWRVVDYGSGRAAADIACEERNWSWRKSGVMWTRRWRRKKWGEEAEGRGRKGQENGRPGSQASEDEPTQVVSEKCRRAPGGERL